MPVGARLAEMARLRLRYDDARRQVQEIQQVQIYKQTKQSKSQIYKQTHLLTNEFNFKTNPKNTNQQSYFDVFLFATISYANRLWIKKQVRIDWFPLQCCFACVCQHLNLTFY